MSAKKIASKAIKGLAAFILASGVIGAIGLLGYFGMIALVPSVALAWIAFGLAGLVDGEVFLQNIWGGLGDSKLLFKSRSVKAHIIQMLDKKLTPKPNKQPPPDDAPPFEKDYYLLKRYIQKFQHKALTPPQKTEKKAAEKRLRRMHKILLAHVLDNKTKRKGTYKAYLSGNSTLLLDIKANLATFYRKKWYRRISAFISLAAGIGFGFATAASLNAALGTLAVALMGSVIWPLAIIAGIGYAVLIYRTFSNIISNDTLQKWKRKIAKWFERRPDEKPLRFWGRRLFIGFCVMLTVSLGVLATLATAGTWWFAVQQGAALAQSATAVANVLRNIFVPIAAAANLFFTTKNTLSSISRFIKSGKKTSLRGYAKKALASVAAYTPKKIRQWHQEKTKLRLLEIYNPFRIVASIISFPFMAVVFIGHIIAMGLTGDRTPGLSYNAMIFSAIIGAFSDAFIDYDYLVPETKTTEELEHEHAKEHDHRHGIIAKWILNTVLIASLLIPLATVWDYVVSRSWGKKEDQKSFGYYFLSNCGWEFHKPLTDNAPLTVSKMNHEIVALHRIEKHQQRLEKRSIDSPLAQSKIDALEILKTQYTKNSKADPNAVKQAMSTLKKPRRVAPHFFHGKRTDSLHMANQLKREFHVQAAAPTA